jgi:hypothetical protein
MAIVAIILFALFAGVASAATTSVTVSDTKGSPGSTVKVPINITGASNVGAIDIVLTYNSNVLSVTGAEKGAITKNSLFDSNKGTSGIVAMGVADTGGINGDGSIANISFNVIGKVGDTSPLKLERVALNDVNSHIDILVTLASGTFTVQEKSGMPLSWTVIGIIIAAVLVILVAILLFARRRKPKPTT